MCLAVLAAVTALFARTPFGGATAEPSRDELARIRKSENHAEAGAKGDEDGASEECDAGPHQQPVSDGPRRP
jgi:hypothetical protein